MNEDQKPADPTPTQQKSAPISVPYVAPPQASVGRPLNIRKILTTIVIIFVVFSVLATIAGWLLFASVINYFAASKQDCEDTTAQIYRIEKTFTKQFDSLVLVPDQPNPTITALHPGGNCVTSAPSLLLSKEYVISTTAGAAYDHVKQVAEQSGYTMSAFTDPCDTSRRQNSFTQLSPKRVLFIDLRCAHTTIEGEDWRQIPATKLIAEFKVGWDSHEK